MSLRYPTITQPLQLHTEIEDPNTFTQDTFNTDTPYTFGGQPLGMVSSVVIRHKTQEKKSLPKLASRLPALVSQRPDVFYPRQNSVAAQTPPPTQSTQTSTTATSM